MAVFQGDEQTYQPAQKRKPPVVPGAQAGYQSWLNNEEALYQPAAPTGVTGQVNTNGYATPSYTAPKPAGAMSGWDQTKWADTTHQTPKYAVGRILSQYQPGIDSLGKAMTEIQQAYPGATWNNKDLLTLPGVGNIDVLSAASTGDPNQMSWWWGDQSAPAGAGSVTGTGGAGTTGASASALTAGAPNYSPIPLGRTTTETDPFYQSQRANVMKLLNQDPTAVTADSPGVKGSLDAYRAEAERARRARLNAEMEQLGAQGVASGGAADTARVAGFENMGRGVANYAAQAVQQEMAARRQEVSQALQLATQMGMTQEAQDLQRQLANLDAELRKQGLNLTQQGMTLDDRYRYAALGQNNQQFNDTLGWQMGQYQMDYPLRYYQMLLNG